MGRYARTSGVADQKLLWCEFLRSVTVMIRRPSLEWTMEESPMARRPFTQVNVFSTDPVEGNPLAVVHSAGGLSDARMATFARWTNLSETTFLMPPTDPGADYQVRIFTPD